MKTYTEAVIEDVPFPLSDPQVIIAPASTPGPGQSYTEARIPEQSFPTVRIATQLIGDVINTKSRKILKELQFTKYGAFQVGEFILGVSGDIRFSPDGFVARNNEGTETIAVDGDTGDVTIRGRLQSGSVVTGVVVVGDSAIQLDGPNRRMVFYDANGIPTIVIGSVN